VFEDLMMNLINALEYPNFDYSSAYMSRYRDLYNEGNSQHSGQYSRVWKEGSELVIARDPLGCNKLFYGYNEKKDFVVANRIERALKLGVHLDNLSSCPPGNIIRVSEDHSTCAIKYDLAPQKDECSFNVDKFKRDIEETLTSAIKWLKSEFAGYSFAVCLSGGLDSSAVASLTAKNLKNITAVSFSYISEKDAGVWWAGESLEKLASVSEDFLSALGVAKALEIPFHPVFRTCNAVKTALPTAVRLCQDWRDFTVHCAVVNLFLAQDVRALFPHGKVLVLTGDLMNEFVCDYHEEVVDGTVYYPQPRMSLENRRRFYIRGLGAGDREIGVFNAFGLPVCQIYSTVAGHYLQVPGHLLMEPDIKETLNGHLLTPGLLGKVCKVKCRAQVGGKDGGTLGICHRMGVDQRLLEDMWIRSLPENLRGDHPLDIIQLGRYRSTPRKW
jgi:hypothetical protein